MNSLEKLKCSNSLHDLAYIVGYKPTTLSYILYTIPDSEKYYEFKIPKKNGGERRINAPIQLLKQLQRNLTTLLNDCFNEIYKDKKSLSHGFRSDHSIITNAIKHKKNDMYLI